ncbi:MAG: rhomboid family intramembrane serine protease [Deltaproteobacteria bacterium]|nr:rhomboid family intramembrane serine protease [Deltaproteobacteria bacterium]
MTTGLVGFATTAIYHVSLVPQPTLTAGASGAIFGLMGMILGLLLKRRDPRWKTWALQGVLLSVLFGFAMRVANNSAHLGGLAAGIVLGVLFAPGAPQPARGWQAALAAVSALACLLSLVLAQLSPLWKMLAQQASG